jgi:hypothetical protein
MSLVFKSAFTGCFRQASRKQAGPGQASPERHPTSHATPSTKPQRSETRNRIARSKTKPARHYPEPMTPVFAFASSTLGTIHNRLKTRNRSRPSRPSNATSGT